MEERQNVPMYRYSTLTGKAWIILLATVILFLLWMLLNDFYFAAGTPMLFPLVGVRILLIFTLLTMGWVMSRELNISRFTNLMTVSTLLAVILEVLIAITRPPDYNPSYITLGTTMFLYFSLPSSPRHKIALGMLYSAVFLFSVAILRTPPTRELVQVVILVVVINIIGINNVFADDRLRYIEVQYYEQTSQQYRNQKVIANATNAPIALWEEGKLIDCNQPFEELWGKSYVDLIGTEIGQCITGVPAIERLVPGEEQSVVATLKLPTGDKRTQASVLTYPLDDVSMMVISVQVAERSRKPGSGGIPESPEVLINLVDELCQLTDREKEIATGILSGWDRNTIGNRLFISPTTVRSHTSNIYIKLGVRNKVEFFHYLMQRQYKAGCEAEDE